MSRLLGLVEKVAVTGATVLINGESGSGKEVIARAVHHYSMRASQSWVDVNCAALPENLLESELFGYEKGAFSGADSSKPGLFEIANRGTLFLDEIGDLDLQDASQAAAGARRFELLPRRRREKSFHRRSPDRRDQSGLESRGPGRPLPSRSLSPPLPDPPFRAASARAHRRYSSTRRILPGRPESRKQQRKLRFSPEVVATSPGISLARQRPRTAQRRHSRRCLCLGPADPSRRICPRNSRNTTFSADLQTLAALPELERNAIAKALEESRGHQQKAATRLGISKRTLQRKIKSYGLITEHTVSVGG